MNIGSIVENLSSFMKKWISIPLIPVPAVMLICASLKRPGLSPMLISSKIISRQGDFGARVGVNIDGSPNMMNQLICVMVEEIVNAIKMDGKVEIGVPPGGITTIGTGENGGGPMVVRSNNVTPFNFSGIIR